MYLLSLQSAGGEKEINCLSEVKEGRRGGGLPSSSYKSSEPNSLASVIFSSSESGSDEGGGRGNFQSLAHSLSRRLSKKRRKTIAGRISLSKCLAL